MMVNDTGLERPEWTHCRVCKGDIELCSCEFDAWSTSLEDAFSDISLEIKDMSVKRTARAAGLTIQGSRDHHEPL